MKPYRILAICVVSLAALAALAACSAGAETLVPTVDVAAQGEQAAATQPAAGQPGGYPAPDAGQQFGYPVGEQAAGEQQAGAQGAYPGPQGVPAADNRSRITAKLIELAPAQDNPAQTRLHVQVLSSEDVEGMPNRTSELVNQEVDLLINSDILPAGLEAGDTLEAIVSYRADERGGIYLAESLAEIAQ